MTSSRFSAKDSGRSGAAAHHRGEVQHVHGRGPGGGDAEHARGALPGELHPGDRAVGRDCELRGENESHLVGSHELTGGPVAAGGHAQPGDAVPEDAVGRAAPGVVRAGQEHHVAVVRPARQAGGVDGERTHHEPGPDRRRDRGARQRDGHPVAEQAVGSVGGPVVVGEVLAVQRRAEARGRPGGDEALGCAGRRMGDRDAGQGRHLSPVADPDRQPATVLGPLQRGHAEQGRVQAPAQERQRVRGDLGEMPRLAHGQDRHAPSRYGRRRRDQHRDGPATRPSQDSQLDASNQQHRPGQPGWRARGGPDRGRGCLGHRRGRGRRNPQAGRQASHCGQGQRTPEKPGTQFGLPRQATAHAGLGASVRALTGRTAPVRLRTTSRRKSLLGPANIILAVFAR